PDGNRIFVRGGKKRDSQGFSIFRGSGNNWSFETELEVEGFEELNRGKFYGATISSDGNHMIIYMGSNPRLPFSDLYYSKKTGQNSFSRPVKLPKNINEGPDKFGPFLAPDDKTMYFASTRRDLGMGDADLYVTQRLDDTWMRWSDPVNLGRPINTPVFDGYISVDSEENIYVAMSGAIIDGGSLDLYVVVPKIIKMQLQGTVTDAGNGENLHAPVEVLIGNKPDTTVYSNRAEGKYSVSLGAEGSYLLKVNKEGYLPATESFSLADVYSDTIVTVNFRLTAEKKIIHLGGTVYDAKTQEPISSATVNIQAGYNGKAIKKNTDAGYYEIAIEELGEYTVTGHASGYMEKEITVPVSDDNPFYEGNIYLEPIEVGTTVVLENIYFDFDKTTLKEESFEELDKVVNFMNENETLEVEISGHTDSKGSDQYNHDLSQGRAQSVVDYIVSHGIGQYRLVAKGYGEEKPIDTNDTEEGRAKNRRVEFTILAK
ncbi:MAG: OmpA family protein, partial [Cyclobacteriaceae bacterium]|nr:OmpA family protein [Cyclobacteriaceae bacterium]